jgi:hypothetical protein
MCQMCDEYENELVRMGLIEDAKTFREERKREHDAAVAAARNGNRDRVERSVVVRVGLGPPRSP